ncbi:MAG: high-potential iron-sulfur protein [Polyangiaceae bacterium]
MQDKMSRRFLLRQSAALGALALLGGTVAACSKKAAALACTDTSGLSTTDTQVRVALAYVDTSVTPGKSCTGCQQFIAPAAAGTCGTCKVVKGPINPGGYCKSFVAKPT